MTGRTNRTLVGAVCGRAVGLVDISVALECVSGRVRDQRRAQLICEYARLVVFCRRVAQPLCGRGEKRRRTSGEWPSCRVRQEWRRRGYGMRRGEKLG